MMEGKPSGGLAACVVTVDGGGAREEGSDGGMGKLANGESGANMAGSLDGERGGVPVIDGHASDRLSKLRCPITSLSIA
ncbi:hypothetical protein MA16_Dca003992 [Dendrobium catenatum]|uniref:Uncharacterized protein n=1 Tax=Dendrobium catenatum TaxID=906689 RepID=A0A2I0X242_9ASPA|nr:hypothetical protein MA16_Dca003992 [Dendrobium catenatum]